ncbi:DUF7344 domain-containing protein [Haloprofundus salinisoli]|uniref:DUF7344 domain-containing protein n=1 Tax=Haloprofundus salinisoli TaxID=2876193 RepID=UPI001CCD1AF9|nr:hypothetical protein [Haloprofundus salinisoli]
MFNAATHSDVDSKATATELFDALADRRRRRILDAVERADDRIPVEVLAKALTGGDANSDEREIQISLVHAHLPKLDDAGLVAYDADEHTVSPTVRTEDALSLVDAAWKVPQ